MDGWNKRISILPPPPRGRAEESFTCASSEIHGAKCNTLLNTRQVVYRLISHCDAIRDSPISSQLDGDGKAVQESGAELTDGTLGT